MPDAVDPLSIAEASIREAEALFTGAPVSRPRRATPPPRPRRVAVRALPRPVTWTGGIALMLAFIPVGWLVSAALFSSAEAVPSVFREPEPLVAEDEFTPSLAVRGERPAGVSTVAYARGRSVTVFRRPRGRSLGRVRAKRIEGRRVPLVFLVKGRRAGWARVYLPVRPNLSLGWVRASDVRYRENPYRLRIDLTARRLTVERHGRVVARKRVGVGQSLSPTPTGTYFVTDLIKARDPRGLYGPYSFGLSGHSEVYTSFRGGNGQIGLHGTNDPGALGSEVSAGCIRVGNGTIRALAKVLPLGTPVIIRR